MDVVNFSLIPVNWSYSIALCIFVLPLVDSFDRRTLSSGSLI